jgi:hypothetical protein
MLTLPVRTVSRSAASCSRRCTLPTPGAPSVRALLPLFAAGSVLTPHQSTAFPFLSQKLFYANGSDYDQNTILNADYSLNEDALAVQGLPRYAPSNAIYYLGCTSFTSFPVALSYPPLSPSSASSTSSRFLSALRSDTDVFTPHRQPRHRRYPHPRRYLVLAAHLGSYQGFP